MSADYELLRRSIENAASVLAALAVTFPPSDSERMEQRYFDGNWGTRPKTTPTPENVVRARERVRSRIEKAKRRTGTSLHNDEFSEARLAISEILGVLDQMS